ncbi:PDDEXK nuclease domain-containing protein [Tessaracoccus caeni]|uniref:PDDEXK nuclease domain-containing protein n=1 Tax=Tessaracoccus caeni TaxID=3031239 RepID=UPI0023D9C828|nr:PDDEXK nuclease domain-containing protein [Tessaracoccus caeni]MDF1488729.1 PDDEXK nuclease domain-containing protein [Tessaracoccus caeni]
MSEVSNPDRLDVLVKDVRHIILTGRAEAVRSVDHHRVVTYWRLGQRIFEEEQDGLRRAPYGAALIEDLARQIQPEFGSGFSPRQLRYARQFYQRYPMWNAVRSELNWYQHRTLIRIEDPDKRGFYEAESIRNSWTGRETERQVNSMLYERLLASSDKESVLAVAHGERVPERPEEIIKDPMMLEFVGLKPQASYYERDLETALITHLQDFLLELGNGFAFVARQRRILLEDDEFFADLVFYNWLLRCFVIVELKSGKLTHHDIGQLQMYVNYFDRNEKTSEMNPTVGILLCADKNDTVVRYSLPVDNTAIHASRYQLYLPTEEQLATQIEREIVAAEQSTHEDEQP